MKNNIITYKGRKIVLNKRLIDDKGLDEEMFDKIKELHKKAIDIDIILSNKFLRFLYRIVLFLKGIFSETPYLMDISINDKETIKHYLYEWMIVQYGLQHSCGFMLDKKYHKFWNLTACTCPKMDNDDRWPNVNYVYSDDCHLHGGIVYK